MVLEEMRRAHPGVFDPCGQGLPYPGSRQRCDLWFGEPICWAIEVKMARFYGDNGKLDDTAIKDLLSPFDNDHSALTDTTKLAMSQLPGRKAVLVYGFNGPKRPLEPAIDAFEILASQRVALGSRYRVDLPKLVHPVHSSGAVFAWEVLATRPDQSPPS
jgi:hypothetical protein